MTGLLSRLTPSAMSSRLGLFAMALVALVMVEPIQRRHRHQFDWGGVLTLLGWTGLLVYALETGGRDQPWGSFPVVGALVSSALLFLAFIVIDIQESLTVDRALAGLLATVTLMMRLVGGTSDCSCFTTNSLPLTLEPGASAELSILFKVPATNAGILTRKAVIWTDCEKQRTNTLRLGCRVE